MLRRLMIVPALALGVGASLAHASFPGRVGRLFFTTFAGDPRPTSPGAPLDLVSIAQNGTGRHVLLSCTTAGYYETPSTCCPSHRTSPSGSCPSSYGFAISPDGRRIAVNYGTAVGLFDPSGRWQQTISITGGSDGQVSWAPDGQRLVIERVRATPPADYVTDTYLLSFDGQQQAFLPDATDVQWNRAGGLAFVRYNSQLQQEDLYVADSNGTHVRRLTRRGAGSPDWSPDGRRIAFTRHDLVFSLWTIGHDGRHARRLTAPYGPMDLAWSPDGKSIAYVTSADTLSPSSYLGGVYIVDLVSSHVHRVAKGTGEFVPALSWQSLPK